MSKQENPIAEMNGDNQPLENQGDQSSQPSEEQTKNDPETDLHPVEVIVVPEQNSGENQEIKITRLPINLPVFFGPLDLLVHLITKKELDIFTISLSDITQDYLDTILKLEHKDLDVGGEYLILASTLIRHKARALLPKDEVEVEEEEISDQILEIAA